MNQNTILDGLINFVHIGYLNEGTQTHAHRRLPIQKTLEFANETDTEKGRDWVKYVGRQSIRHTSFRVQLEDFVFTRNSFWTPFIHCPCLCVVSDISEELRHFFFAFCENLSKHFECEVKVRTHSMFWQTYMSALCRNGSMCCNQH